MFGVGVFLVYVVKFDIVLLFVCYKFLYNVFLGVLARNFSSLVRRKSVDARSAGILIN